MRLAPIRVLWGSALGKALLMRGILLLRKIFGILFVGLVLSTSFATPTAGAQPIPQGYAIANLRTGLCAREVPPGDLDGPVDQVVCNASRGEPGYYHQRWSFIQTGGSGFLIRNMATGLCLDLPYYGSVPAGTKVTGFTCATTSDNQTFTRVTRANGYWFVNWPSQLCLDVDGFGTGGVGAELTLWPCTDDDDHNWTTFPPIGEL